MFSYLRCIFFWVTISRSHENLPHNEATLSRCKKAISIFYYKPKRYQKFHKHLMANLTVFYFYPCCRSHIAAFWLTCLVYYLYIQRWKNLVLLVSVYDHNQTSLAQNRNNHPTLPARDLCLHLQSIKSIRNIH